MGASSNKEGRNDKNNEEFGDSDQINDNDTDLSSNNKNNNHKNEKEKRVIIRMK